jgi:hypothetical protein
MQRVGKFQQSAALGHAAEKEQKLQAIFVGGVR